MENKEKIKWNNPIIRYLNNPNSIQREEKVIIKGKTYISLHSYVETIKGLWRDVISKDQPLERISEETRPTGEKELLKEMMDIINWQSYVECDIFEDKKTLQEQENEASELIENKAKTFIQKVLSLAREEGKEEQAELDRKIYGMSVEEFSKNYKVVEPLQNGEREEIVSLLTGWISNPTVVKTILEKIDEMLSQSKKELLERIKAEATNRATDIEKHREPICREYFTEIARSRLLEEILNRELESLTNQKKDI